VLHPKVDPQPRGFVMVVFVHLLRSLVFGCLLVVGVAQAQAPRDAATLYRSAETHYKLQQYQESLTEFQDSYELSKEPAILFNIGQCYRQLDRLEDAKKSFQFFVRDAPSHAKRATAEKLIEELDAEIAKQSNKGKIIISAAQDPAEVFINGVYQGRSPITLSNLDPKKYNLMVKKVGYVNYEVKAAVKPAQTIELVVPTLTPVGEATILWPSKRYTRSSAALGGLGVVAAGGALFLSSLAIKTQNDGVLDDKVQEQDKLRSLTFAADVSVLASIVSTTSAATVLGIGFLRREK
jgi:hypothetical protein